VRSIGNARDGVSALDPPATAQDVHDRLVDYLDLNVDVARDTERLAEYVPAAQRASRRLTEANRALQDRLAGAEQSDEQADALDGFGESVATTLEDLRALDPPTVLEPAHEHQVRQLAQTRRLAGGLRRALIEEDAEGVARLLKRFRASAAEQRPPRLASKQALAQYTRRLRQPNAAYAEIRREQVALARELQ